MTELPDRLLRDALRDEASRTPSPMCLDADRLAAWADGTMTDAERATIEAHAAGCARCLSLFAAMTRTEPLSIAPPWWRRWPVAWLVPLAAATAGLIIVVRLAVLEQRSAGVPASPTPAAAAPPPIHEPKVAPAPAPLPSTSLASQAPAPMRRQRHEPVEVEAARAAPPATETAAKETAPAPKPTATPAPGAPPPTTAAATALPPAPAAPPAQAPPSAQVTVSAAAGAAGGRIAGGRGVSARALAEDSLLKTTADAASAPIRIPSPDRDSQWRIVAGTVERTADGGATWQPQALGVATPVRAGTAPGARVCWLAGVAGVVLRTTDGITWTRIPFPEAVDLVAIQASDALQATVTTADGRHFTTNDGGATWGRR